MRFAGYALAAVVGLCAGSAAMSVDALRGVSVAHADASIVVGQRLVATRSVSLEKAKISKGSQVSVTRVAHQGPHTWIDVELADGYVVKRVALSRIREAFRILRGG